MHLNGSTVKLSSHLLDCWELDCWWWKSSLAIDIWMRESRWRSMVGKRCDVWQKRLGQEYRLLHASLIFYLFTLDNFNQLLFNLIIEVSVFQKILEFISHVGFGTLYCGGNFPLYYSFTKKKQLSLCDFKRRGTSLFIPKISSHQNWRLKVSLLWVWVVQGLAFSWTFPACRM